MLFRSRGGESDGADEAGELRLQTVAIGQGAAAVGRSIREFELGRLGVDVTLLRRGEQRMAPPPPAAESEIPPKPAEAPVQPRLGGLEPPQQPRTAEDDLLEIPTFLRRQAN